MNCSTGGGSLPTSVKWSFTVCSLATASVSPLLTCKHSQKPQAELHLHRVRFPLRAEQRYHMPVRLSPASPLPGLPYTGAHGRTIQAIRYARTQPSE